MYVCVYQIYIHILLEAIRMSICVIIYLTTIWATLASSTLNANQFVFEGKWERRIIRGATMGDYLGP